MSAIRLELELPKEVLVVQLGEEERPHAARDGLGAVPKLAHAPRDARRSLALEGLEPAPVGNMLLSRTNTTKSRTPNT